MLRTMPLRHKLESLYNCYLDSRAAASRNSRVVSDDPEHKLAALLGAGGPLLTRAELRDELERCLSETKVDAATDTPFPNPEKAAAGPYTASRTSKMTWSSSHSSVTSAAPAPPRTHVGQPVLQLNPYPASWSVASCFS